MYCLRYVEVRSMRNCQNCNNQCEHNYCDWTCHVEYAKKLGGEIHTPNGLPISCVKADGTMLEHEHGDHKDYKFPVVVTYVGERVELPDWFVLRRGSCVDLQR